MTIRANILRFRHLAAARLCDQRGFMLAEQLVSIIFIGLLCIVVAAGLGAAMSAYTNITKQTQADIMLSQAVEAVSDELVYALDVENDGLQSEENPLYFTSVTRHELAVLQQDDRGIWLNAAGEQSRLVPAENGLTPQLESLSYNEATGIWSFEITIKSDTTTLAETTMNVKRIGS